MNVLWLAVGVAVASTLLWLATAYPRHFLYALIALLPTQFLYIPVQDFFVSPEDALVGFGAAGLLLRLAIGDRKSWRALWRHRWFLAMVLGYCVGFVILGSGNRGLVRVLLAIVPGILACAELRSERSIRTALACLVAAGVADAAYGLYFAAIGVSFWANRFSAIAGVNFDAMVFLVAAAIGWSLWTSVRRLLVAVGLTGLGAATLSRGGLLAFLLAFVSMIRPVLRRNARRLAIAMGAVFFAVILGFGPARQVLTERLAERTLDTAGGISSVDVRLLVARVAWNVFLSRPLTGLGYAGFFPHSIDDPDVDYATSGEGVYTHNTLLEILAEGGLLAFLPFCLHCLTVGAAAFWLWKRVRRRRDRVAAAVVSSLIIVVVSGIFANVMLHFFVWAVAGLTLACRDVADRREKWAPRTDTTVFPGGPVSSRAGEGLAASGNG